MVAGEDALDALVAHRQDHVALARAERADRAGVLDVPGAGPEPVGVRGQRPHRAELDDVAVEGGDVGAVVERAHEGRRAPLQELELLVLGHLLAEAHAAVAEDASLAVDLDQRRERDRLLEVALGVDHAASAGAPAHRDVLQRALAALVADGAVERVVDEQELDHRLPGRPARGRCGCRRPSRRGPASSRRSEASGSPRSPPGTSGRRRPDGRASARSRTPGSRRRRAWRRRPASSPPPPAPRPRRRGS